MPDMPDYFPRMVNADDLTGTRELAEMFHVSPVTIISWVRRYPDAPRPLKQLRMGPVYSLREWEIWYHAKWSSKGESQ